MPLLEKVSVAELAGTLTELAAFAVLTVAATDTALEMFAVPGVHLASAKVEAFRTIRAATAAAACLRVNFFMAVFSLCFKSWFYCVGWIAGAIASCAS